MKKRSLDQTQNQLIDAQERYQTFLKYSSEGIWRIELEKPVPVTLPVKEQIAQFYKYAYLAECNVSMAKMYGFKSPDELIGARLGELLPKKNPQNIEYLSNFISSKYRLNDAESLEVDRYGNTKHFFNNLVGIIEKGMLLRAWGTQRDVTKQKEIEKSINLLATITKNFHDAVIATDNAYLITQWNKGAQNMYGWKEQEVIGKYAGDIVPTRYTSTLKQREWQESLRKYGYWSGEVLQKTKSGKEIVVSATLSHLKDENGEVTGLVAVNRDISAYKESEKERISLLAEVQQQKVRLNKIIDDIPGIVWEGYGKPATSTQKLDYISPFAATLSGYSMKECQSPQFWIKVIHPDDKKRVLADSVQLFLHKRSGSHQFRIITKKGKTVWVEAIYSPILNNEGESIGLRGVTLDITQRKQAEEALAESEEKYRYVVEYSMDLITIMDAQGTLSYISPSVERITGYTVQELQGKSGFDLVHPDDRKRAEDEMRKILQGTVGKIPHYRLKHKEKGWIIMEGYGSAIMDKSGKKPRMVITTSRDITERMELERRKDEFISMASHELKTPVTTLKLYTQLLQKQAKKYAHESVESSLLKMNSQIDRLTYLINDLLDLSRIQTGKLTFRYNKCSLMELVQDVIADLQPTSQHDIQLRGKTDIFITADKDRLSQVLINLLTNAIKYSPDADKVIVTIKEKKGMIEVSVQDFGIGIAKKHQDKIFDRYYQIASSNGSTGLGIGLYISQEIIKRHKGTLKVTSDMHKGSTFTFTLPIFYNK